MSVKIFLLASLVVTIHTLNEDLGHMRLPDVKSQVERILPIGSPVEFKVSTVTYSKVDGYDRVLQGRFDNYTFDEGLVDIVRPNLLNGEVVSLKRLLLKPTKENLNPYSNPVRITSIQLEVGYHKKDDFLHLKLDPKAKVTEYGPISVTLLVSAPISQMTLMKTSGAQPEIFIREFFVNTYFVFRFSLVNLNVEGLRQLYNDFEEQYDDSYDTIFSDSRAFKQDLGYLIDDAKKRSDFSTLAFLARRQSWDE